LLIHHASAGDLDKRGTSDVWTMTVQEYLAASRWKKFAYRLARNPFVLFVIAPLFLFLAGTIQLSVNFRVIFGFTL